MKIVSSLFTMVLMTMAFNAQALNINIEKNDASLYPITSATLIDVKTLVPNCPAGAMCEPASVATISFPLNGCLDRLAGATVSRTYAQVNGATKTVLTVTGIGLENEKSKLVKCIVAPTALLKVNLGLGFYTKEDVLVKTGAFVPTVK